MLQARIFAKYKLHHRCADNCRKIWSKYSWEQQCTDTSDNCFNGLLMLNQLTNQNDFIFSCCQRDVSVWIRKAVLYPPADANSERRQASQIVLLAMIVNIFKLILLFFKFHCRSLQGLVTPLICFNAGN